MSPNDPTCHATAVERTQEDETRQWEQYLHETTMWDHFLNFSPEALQWTYNVQ
jgi:hypothetical protein